MAATALDRADSGDRAHGLSTVLDLTAAHQAVDDLLHFRNTYLEGTAREFGLFDDGLVGSGLWANRAALKRLLDRVRTQSQEKSQNMWEKFTTTVNILRQLEPNFASGSPQEKAEFCYLNGKAMNAILSSEDDDDDNEDATTIKEADEEEEDAEEEEEEHGAGKVTPGSPKRLRPSEISKGNLVSTAVQWLTRALKFSPRLPEAWCELGECYWRQGDLVTAKHHFNQALKIDATYAEALCQLSMLLRHLPATSDPDSTSATSENGGSAESLLQQRHSAEIASTSTLTEEATKSGVEGAAAPGSSSPLGESLRLAYAAVQLRPLDGHGWLILGNALLTAFFADPLAPFGLPTLAQVDVAGGAGDSKPSTTQLMMSRCLSAYAQAAKETSTLLEPNFHFNRGLAFHFQDMFSQCLTSWLRAVCLDPHWPNPRSRAVRLANFLLAVADLHRPRSPTGGLVEETFTLPLATCLCLRAPDVSEPAPESGEKSRRKKPTLSDRQLANSLSRLLGPFCASLAGSDGDVGLVPRASASDRRRARKAQKKFIPAVKVKADGQGQVESAPGDKTTGWKLVYFNELQTGTNQGCLCVGRLVRRLPTDSVLAVNLLLVDALNQPITVRLCNVGEGLGPADKDILVIPHPYVEEREVDVLLVRAAHTIDRLLSSSRPDPSPGLSEKGISQLRLEETGEGNLLRIRFIRVPLPNLLVVNGQPVGSKWTATPVLQNVFFTPV